MDNSSFYDQALALVKEAVEADGKGAWVGFSAKRWSRLGLLGVQIRPEVANVIVPRTRPWTGDYDKAFAMYTKAVERFLTGTKCATASLSWEVASRTPFPSLGRLRVQLKKTLRERR